MKITLNLATRPFADLGPVLKQLRIGISVLVVLAGLFALGLHLLHGAAEQARQRDHSLDGQIAHIASERQGYEALMQQPDNARLLAESGALNGLFEQKAFSWTLTMENLETVLPAGVQVLTLEPTREKDGRIVVHLRVAGPRDHVVDLVRALEHSARFRLPRIVGESAEQSSGTNQHLEPVSASNRFTFDILADYNPPAPGERKPHAKAAVDATSTVDKTGKQAKAEPGKVALRKPSAKPHTTAGGAR
jgi:type IV pilus assembly protein PilN